LPPGTSPPQPPATWPCWVSRASTRTGARWCVFAWPKLTGSKNQYPAALKQYLAVMETPDLPEGVQTLALAPVMQLAVQSADVPPGVFDALLKRIAALPPKEQIALRMNMARSLAQAGKPEEAARAYEAVLTMTELKPRDKLEVILQMGHSLAAGRQFPQARAEYARIAEAADAPASYRTYAMLCTARTYVLQQQWPQAREEYAKLLKAPDLPQVHQWEATRAWQRSPAWRRACRPGPRGQPREAPAGPRARRPVLRGAHRLGRRRRHPGATLRHLAARPGRGPRPRRPGAWKRAASSSTSPPRVPDNGGP